MDASTTDATATYSGRRLSSTRPLAPARLNIPSSGTAFGPRKTAGHLMPGHRPVASSILALTTRNPFCLRAAANSAALVCGTGIVSLKRTMRTGLAFCTYLPMVFPIAFSGKNQDPNIARGAKVVAVGANAVPPTPHPNGFAPQSPGAAGAFFRLTRRSFVPRLAMRGRCRGAETAPAVAFAGRHMPVDEPLGVLREIDIRVECPLEHLPRDVLGYVPRPALGGVEGEHSERVSVLAGEKIADDGLAIGLGGVGFVIGDAKLPVVVQDQVNGDVVGRL
jgi:hypothetical protein